MNIIEQPEYFNEVKTIASSIPHMECTILVTGATGMIGSCITDVLLTADRDFGNGIKVVLLGRSREKMAARFAYCEGEAYLSFIEQDVGTPLQTEEELDYIIHTASNADPRNYALYPAETLIANVYGVNNMLVYCRNHRKTRLLMTSTFEVYGRKEGQTEYQEEDSGEIDLNQIRSCYPESKRTAEILMRCYHREYDVDCVIARLSSVYGPTMSPNDSKAHAQFIRNGLRGEDIVLKSEGIQRRTYTYLVDCVSGILTVLFQGKSGEAYNVSNENSVASIAELANIVASICGTKVSYALPDMIERQGFSRPQDCVLVNKKLKALGWHGMYGLQDGLEKTVEILKTTRPEMTC